LELRSANLNCIRDPTYTRNPSGIKIGQSINQTYKGAKKLR
jgi:hypothetical protein